MAGSAAWSPSAHSCFGLDNSREQARRQAWRAAVASREVPLRHVGVRVLREVGQAGQLGHPLIGLVSQPDLFGLQADLAERRQDVGLVAGEDELRVPRVDPRIGERSEEHLKQMRVQARIDLSAR